MKRINLFVFATHHLSNNVASQRFNGLLKYLDPTKYRVFVFTRDNGSVVQGGGPSPSQDVTVFPVSGHCVGSESSVFSSVLMLAAAFFRPLPFMLSRPSGSSKAWFVSALAEADRLCREKLAVGEHCVVVGTYSPIDALIAAASLANRHHIGCLQDFRDGLVFEPLGKPSWLRSVLRKLIEQRVLDACGLITSVSEPLVEDFRQRYPDKATQILPNGYDPEEFSGLSNDADIEEKVARILERHVPEGSTLVGHFGRIGASDASASTSLQCFVEAMNDADAQSAKAHVMFVGELTPSERAWIDRANFSVSVLDPVERRVAIQLMKRCHRLLLLTGSRVSCATGKLFEYLAAGAEILCVSAVHNAATDILTETCAGRTLLTSEIAADSNVLQAALLHSNDQAGRDIRAYSRVEQAGMLDGWISGMVLT
jgi:glycosyltransferase involved in cell wall biosynthesis